MISSFDKLIINLAGVRVVDCGGLGSLASVLALAVDRGKQVKITHASPLIREMLRVTHLEQFLEHGESAGPQLVAGGQAAVA